LYKNGLYLPKILETIAYWVGVWYTFFITLAAEPDFSGRNYQGGTVYEKQIHTGGNR
jgi:hypothetical protein